MLNTERVCERLRRQDNREFFSQPNPRLLLVFFFTVSESYVRHISICIH